MADIKSKLPSDFFDYMKNTLRQDYDEYEALIDEEAFRGLRVNRLKVSDDELKKLLKIDMNKTPFCDNGYYIDNSISGLGNNPLHHAGAFYLQEPSAMSAVTALDVRSDDFVLDLCAAPGGKSTQIAEKLSNEGLLVSNEIVAQRARILASNIERLGITNAVVTNSSSDVLCSELSGFFDKVLVDAPCSGEGMLRREENAVKEWQLSNHEMCKIRTESILDNAAMALKIGGILVYSTCTLSAEENEQTIAEFVKRHPEFELEEISTPFGRKAYNWLCDNEDIEKARRILYMDGGEGHFVARLKKNALSDEFCYVDLYKNADKIPIAEQFLSDNFIMSDELHRLHLINDNVYIYPENCPVLNKIRIVKCGVLAGKIIKNRFEPAHDLYISRNSTQVKNIVDFDVDSSEILKFLHGDVIPCDKKGYVAVAVNGIITGFGKASGGQLKNHYPKGLRIL